MAMSPKWDMKQLGVGGGSVLGLLFIFQSQGVDLMTKAQDAQSSVIIEKTIANTTRITKLEVSMNELSRKIDSEFNNIRTLVRDGNQKILDLVHEAASDRYTRTDHNGYARTLEMRLQRIERDIQDLIRSRSKSRRDDDN